MRTKEHSLRGRVRMRWEKSAKQDWDAQKTLSVCKAVDQELEAEGHNPAPQFRKAVTITDNKYLNNWVGGCRFEWRKRP